MLNYIINFEEKLALRMLLACHNGRYSLTMISLVYSNYTEEAVNVKLVSGKQSYTKRRPFFGTTEYIFTHGRAAPRLCK